MIAKIARKECTEMWRDGRFRWAAGMVFLLLVAALLLGWQHHAKISSEHKTAQEISRRQWLEQGEKNPHSAAHHSIFAFKPLAPLALADSGVDPFAGVAVWLEAHKQNEAVYSPARDATSAGRFGQLTAATVLQVLIPLIIILLTFGAFAVEREQGTLRHALSMGVTRRQLAFGKVTGVALALGVLLAPAALLGAFVLALSNESAAFSSPLPRLFLLVLIYLAYFAVFLTVALAVSALAGSSRLALVALLAFWSVNLILPRLATEVSKSIYPTPSALEFQSAVARDMREGIDGHNPYDQRGEQLKQKLLAEYKVKSVQELPINFAGVALQAGEEYGSEVYDRRYGELWAAYENQHRLHTFAGIAAPLAVVRSLSMSLAGSDWHHHRHFAEAAEVYRRMLVKRMNDEVTYNSVSRDYDKNTRGRELYEQVPDFSYQPPALVFVADNQNLAFELVMIWLIGGAFTLLWAIKRMKMDAKDF